MRTVYSDLNIKTAIDGISFQVLQIGFERFERSMPAHSHGSGSYEWHYIPYGRGQVDLDGTLYDIEPGTLYMTGPHVRHEQFSDPADPMGEYCIYFKVSAPSADKKNQNSPAVTFMNTPRWFGKDSQDLYPFVQQIFHEMERQQTGYLIQVQSLILSVIIKTVRNYEWGTTAEKTFSPVNLMDSKYLIAEESFLYDYRDLTLEGLADRLGLGIRQTERFIKENYGKTFLQKKTEARMSMARIYLQDHSISVNEVADKLGYASSQHFSYAFRQYFGRTATEYRNGKRP